MDFYLKQIPPVDSSTLRELMQIDMRRNGFLQQLRERTVTYQYYDNPDIYFKNNWKYVLKHGKIVECPWDKFNGRKQNGFAILFEGNYCYPCEGLKRQLEQEKSFAQKEKDYYEKYYN